MIAEKLLSKLEGVRSTGGGRWVARCPSHEDRVASLAIRECDDGRVLVHCFGGCEVEDVLASVGLSFTTLFPERLGEFKSERRPFDSAQALAGCAHELLVANLILQDTSREGPPDAIDTERLHLVSVRLQRALDAICVFPGTDMLREIRRALA